MATSLFFSGLTFIMLRGDVCLMVFRLLEYRKLELGFILMSCALENTNVWVQTHFINGLLHKKPPINLEAITTRGKTMQ